MQENKAVVDLTANAEKRTVLTPTKIEEITDHALSGAVQQATITWWNEAHPSRPIHKATVSKYAAHKRSTGEYFKPSNRGPKRLLTEQEEERLTALTVLTRRLGWGLTSNRFSALARGLAKKTRGERSVEPVLGLHAYTLSWAIANMKRMGMRVRSATTDRTVELSTVVNEGKAWWSKLSQCQTDTRLIFIMDEFFCALEQNHWWTWQRAANKRAGAARIYLRGEAGMHILRPYIHGWAVSPCSINLAGEYRKGARESAPR